MEGVRADKLHDGVGRAYGLMQCSGSKGREYKLIQTDELHCSMTRVYELMHASYDSVR